MSNIVNKVKEAVTGHSTDTTGTAGTHTAGTTHNTGGGLTGTHAHNTTAGPHSSDMANKLDPRVDSDLDGSRTAGAGTGAYGSGVGGNTSGLTGTSGGYGTGHSGTHGTGTHGTHGTHAGGMGTSGGYGTHGTSAGAGPHDSSMANKLDPRVDSDTGYATGTAGHGTHSGTGGGLTGSHGTHSGTGGGLTGSHGTHSGTGGGLTGSHGHNTTAGPHSSDMANKLDPRVDSDRDGSRNVPGAMSYGSSTDRATGGAETGALGGTHGTGMHGTHGAGTHGVHDTHSHGTHGTGTHGVHDTHSHGTHGTHGTHGVGSGTGPAPNTAGPHKSDMMNKLDPRVDSDLDGSKTVGGDKTFSGSGNTTKHGVDTHDAAQVPPSQFGKEPGHHTATMGSRQGSI